MGKLLAVAALVAAPGPAWADGADVQVRYGQIVEYYDSCRIATNILEPGVPDDSHLIVTDCVLGETVETIAPSWVMDGQASYGQTIVNGRWFGECWLIRLQLIDNASHGLLVECRAPAPVIYRSGFDSNDWGSP